MTAIAIEKIQAIAEAIRDLGEVPSGHLYANVMAYIDLHTYEAIVGILTRSGLVRKQGDVLAWIAHRAT